MVVYIFHPSDGAKRYSADQGLSFPSARSALQEGRAASCLLKRSLSEHMDDWSGWRIKVVNRTGRTVVVLPFALFLGTSRLPRDPNSQRARAWG